MRPTERQRTDEHLRLVAEAGMHERQRDRLRTEALRHDATAKRQRAKLAEMESAPEKAARLTGAILRPPRKTLAGAPLDVESINVYTPGCPAVVRIFIQLTCGKVAALDISELDAFKLERRLAWKLDELDRDKASE
ncbi:hypothetical protein LCGC14_0273850 [marine sediment metagenome]|uniref:Uncharacterized protein n=2 Tax=root TaxID=1 RepID=A0A9C9NIL7_9HYPH|nr:hypothetical protein [Aurantimonas coralicida]